MPTGFEFSMPVFPDEGLADEADVDSDAEIHSDVQDEVQGDIEDWNSPGGMLRLVLDGCPTHPSHVPHGYEIVSCPPTPYAY